MTQVLFVYGTLMPGQPRWDLLQRYAADPGWPAQVVGQLFDTGCGYPVAHLHPADGPGPAAVPPGEAASVALVRGHCVPLLSASRTEALAALDRYEEVDLGMYARIRISTARPAGTICWAYTLGPGGAEHFGDLQPIPDGDWLHHLSR